MNRHDIGRRIEVYRDKIKMSTQELAQRINRSQATISRIENGKQGLTFELLARIASVLHVHPFALLSDEPLRYSALLPPRVSSGSEEESGEYACTLLANALFGGRVRRGLHRAAAAAMLGVAAGELEIIELSLGSPEDTLLEQLCNLYGLSFEEMRILRRFDEEAPTLSRSMANLQRIFSRMYHMLQQSAPETERQTLDAIARLLESAKNNNPIPPETDDPNTIPSSLSLPVLSALRDRILRLNGDTDLFPAPGSGEQAEQAEQAEERIVEERVPESVQ